MTAAIPSPRTSRYCVDGLCCADEETLIRKKLSRLRGVDALEFNLLARSVTVKHSCPPDEIVAALRSVGFTARLERIGSSPGPADAGSPRQGESSLPPKEPFWKREHPALFVSVSGLALVAGLLCEYIGFPETAVLPLLLVSVLSGGWRVGVKGWQAARHLTPDMNFLMAIAAIGALAIGKWEESAAVIFLFALSQLFERFSLERSRKAIRSLLTLTPPVARVQRERAAGGGAGLVVPVEEVQPGERITIRPGERIPLDGVVEAGESTVNQAPITGESVPVRKRAGDEVFAGTLNERGTLEVTTLRPYFDTVLARVVRMVEEAQARRAPIQQMTERFARLYTPAVISLAVLVAAVPPIALGYPFGVWFYRALVLLVIACPCALVISVPVTIFSGLANAARRGILLKGGRFLEAIGMVDAVAFDKTGTLTMGVPRVTDIIPLNSLSENDILRLSAAVESGSEHHLAGAIQQRAREQQQLPADPVSYQHFEALAGRGVRARIDGVTYFLGSHGLIEEQGICSPRVEEVLARLEREGKSTIVLGTEREALGVIAIADEVRSESRTIMKQLHAEGVRKVIMLTGDNRGTAEAIAAKTGIDEVYAGVLPEEKAARIRSLREAYRSVAMVGDGINDAPALAESSIGIAMGRSGTGVALETADVVLMSDDLSKLPYLLRLSRKTRSIIRQNIALALAIKVLFIGLALLGISTLWMAVLADDGATLVVILNGLRVLRLREPADAGRRKPLLPDSAITG